MKTVKVLVCVAALLLCLTAGNASSAGVDNPDDSAETANLPAGFIARSEKHMPWNEAVAFCKERGGRLPLVAGLTQWDGMNPPIKNIPIDGFGNHGRPWDEVGLPVGPYWTGTVAPDFPDTPTIVDNFGGMVDFSDRMNDSAAACVPANPVSDAPVGQTKKTDQETAKDFVKQLRTLAAEGKSREVAALVSYPLTVNKKPRLTIKDAEAFIKNYDAVFSKSVRECLRDHKMEEDVFVSNGQYMVGWGCIWFFPDKQGNMAISAINPDD